MDVPYVKRVEYQFLSADEDTGEVSLLQEQNNTKHNMNLATFVQTGKPTDDDKQLVKDILAAQEKRNDINVIVLCACGNERIAIKARKGLGVHHLVP